MKMISLFLALASCSFLVGATISLFFGGWDFATLGVVSVIVYDMAVGEVMISSTFRVFCTEEHAS